MTTAETITSMYNNVKLAYDALATKGATLPEDKNLANLASTVESIVSGGGSVPIGEYGKLIYADSLEDSPSVKEAAINTVDDFNALCTAEPSITLGETNIDKKMVLAFVSAQMPNEIPADFLSDCPHLDYSPITVPNNVTTIGDNFLAQASSYNQTITLSNALTSIGNKFLSSALNFNQPITFPATLSTIGAQFLYNAPLFNQPITIENITSIGDHFLRQSSAMNSDVSITGTNATLGASFMQSTNMNDQAKTIKLLGTWSNIGDQFLTYSTNLKAAVTINGENMTVGNFFMYSCSFYIAPLKITGLTHIGNSFMNRCTAYGRQINFLDNVETIGDSFMSECTAWTNGVSDSTADYNSYDLVLPATLTKIGTKFLNRCSSFNRTVDLSATQITAIPTNFLSNATSVSKVILPPNLVTIGNSFLLNCAGLIAEVVIPETVTSIGSFFMGRCTSYTAPLSLPAGVKTFPTNFMRNCLNFTGPLALPGITGFSSIGGGELNNTFSDTVPVYATGITITGAGATTVKNKFANTTTKPWRKLILSNS